MSKTTPRFGSKQHLDALKEIRVASEGPRSQSKPTYTDAVLFVRELRERLNVGFGADLSHEELTMVFMVLDSLIPDEEHDAW